MVFVWKNKAMGKSIQVKGKEKSVPERRKSMCKCHEVGRSLVLSKKQKEAHVMGIQKRVA